MNRDLELLIHKWMKNCFFLPVYDFNRKRVGMSKFDVVVAEANNCVLRIAHLDKEPVDYFGYNFHQSLNMYRKQIDSDDLLIGCAGAYQNFYVQRIMIRDTFGLNGVLTKKGETAYAKGLPVIETFLLADDLNLLTTFIDQRNYQFELAER